MPNVILRMWIHPLLSIPVLMFRGGRGRFSSCGKLVVNDEFDINALRKQFRSAVFVDRRQANREPESPRMAGRTHIPARKSSSRERASGRASVG